MPVWECLADDNAEATEWIELNIIVVPKPCLDVYFLRPTHNIVSKKYWIWIWFFDFAHNKEK